MIMLRQGKHTVELYVHLASYCFGYATKVVLSEWADPLAYSFYTLSENVIPESVFLDPAHFFVPTELLADSLAWTILQRNRVLEPVSGGARLSDGRQAYHLCDGVTPDTDSRHPENREGFLRFWGYGRQEEADPTAPRREVRLPRRTKGGQTALSLSREMALALELVLDSPHKAGTLLLYSRHALDFDRWMEEHGQSLSTIDQEGMLAYRHHLAETRTQAMAASAWSAVRRCIGAAIQLKLRADDPAAAIRGLRIISASTSQEE